MLLAVKQLENNTSCVSLHVTKMFAELFMPLKSFQTNILISCTLKIFSYVTISAKNFRGVMISIKNVLAMLQSPPKII
jgi:hypothetical protein